MTDKHEKITRTWQKRSTITGEWHPIYKALRDKMFEDCISWTKLVLATSTAETTLQANFAGRCMPNLDSVERVANALGFHLALVPMSEAEVADLNDGKYVNPGIMEVAQCAAMTTTP
jgi:hypothetical protein